MKTWYLFSQGETFGPLPTDVVRVMLKQKRVTLVEFIWGEGTPRWERIRDVPEFGDKGLPPYPPVEIPPLQEGYGAEMEEVTEVEEAVAELDEVEEEEVAEEMVADETSVEDVEVEAEEEEEEAVPVRAAAATKAKPAARAKVARPPVSPPAAAPAPAPKPLKKAKLKLVPPPAAKASPAAKKAVIKPKKRKDIRAAERCPVEGSVSIEGGKAGKILDVSESGCLVAAAELMDPGTPVEFVLKSSEIEGTPWQMTGIIVRAENSQMGIEFTRVNPMHKRQLAQLVKEKLG